MQSGAAGPAYALGHSQQELKRLSTQARLFEPFTRRFFEAAGLARGMRVLDVGSGSGDVAFLAASLVGGEGEVTGTDKARAAVEKATERARAAGLANVSFVTGDATELAFAAPFDAIVGRLVMTYQPDVAATLRKLRHLLRPGGIIAFQEFDIDGAKSWPEMPTYRRCLDWMDVVFKHTGADVRVGLKLYGAFRQAGLPAPSLTLDASISGGSDSLVPEVVSEVIRSLLPLIERLGVATKADVDMDTLCDRLRSELVAGGGVAISPSLIGAWARVA